MEARGKKLHPDSSALKILQDHHTHLVIVDALLFSCVVMMMVMQGRVRGEQTDKQDRQAAVHVMEGFFDCYVLLMVAMVT